MGTYRSIGLLLLMLLLCACGAPVSASLDRPSASASALTHQPASAPRAESPIPPTSPLTAATLPELRLLGAAALPTARAAAIAPAGDRLAVATSTSVVLFALPALQQLQSVPRSLPQRAEPIRLGFHPAGTAVMVRETIVGEGLGDCVTSWPIVADGALGEAHARDLLIGDQLVPTAVSADGAVAWQDPGSGQIMLQQSGQITRTLTTGADIPDLLHVSTDPDKIAPSTTTNVTALEFSPRGSLLGLGSQTGKILLFQLAEGSRPQPLDVPDQGPGAAIRQLAFSPDAGLVAARLADRLLVWQVGVRLPLLELKALPQYPDSQPVSDAMIFSPDNQLLVTATADGVTFYEVKTGAVLRRLSLQSQGLALSPDGRFLVIVHDGIVSVWGSAPDVR